MQEQTRHWSKLGNCAIPEAVPGTPVTKEVQRKMAAEVDAALWPDIPTGPTVGDPWEAGRELCDSCPVKSLCLQAGMNEAFGMWGGTTPEERVVLRGSGQETTGGQLALFDEAILTQPLPPETAAWGQRNDHGTMNRYVTHKCRCVDCRAAATAYRRERALAKQGEGDKALTEEAAERRKANRRRRYQELKDAGLSAVEAARAC